MMNKRKGERGRQADMIEPSLPAAAAVLDCYH